MTNEPLRLELLNMQEDDLRMRDELIRDGTLFDGYAGPMTELHRYHNARLREIIDRYGWPGRSLVGDDGAAAAWLLLQHAILDPALMRDAAALVAKAAEQGEIDRTQVAFLTDRIRVLEGRTQVYGTQYDWDKDGNLSPVPIEQPAMVDELRLDVGLEPLDVNTERLQTHAVEEGERPSGDWNERQKEMDRWARSVGWRKSSPRPGDDQHPSTDIKFRVTNTRALVCCFNKPWKGDRGR